MSILKKLSAIVPALVLLGTVGTLPARALQIVFGSDGADGGVMRGSLAIDNTLIQSGATTFGADEIDFFFRDRDFLSTTTADGVSVRLLDELGSSGFLSFAVLTTDALDDEPWADRYTAGHYAGIIRWGTPADSTSFTSFISWMRPTRVVGAILPIPHSQPPDIVRPSGLGVWFGDLYNGTSNAFAYASDFPILDDEVDPNPEPTTSVPEPSSVLALLLLGGAGLLQRKFKITSPDDARII